MSPIAGQISWLNPVNRVGDKCYGKKIRDEYSEHAAGKDERQAHTGKDQD
jgi:hypothetical protein